ncbi:MAG: hypothetical protein AAGE01_06640 [Pseudomonadota bacterium]
MSTELLRMVLAQFGDIEEWRLGDPELAAQLGYPRSFSAPIISDYATLFIDYTLDARDGKPVCHEVNGANAVGSDALTGDSSRRAKLEAQQAVNRSREFGLLGQDLRPSRGIVTIHAHQHWRWFRTGGEFYPRVDAFAEALRNHWPGHAIVPRSAGDALGDETVSVMVGDVPAIGERLAFDEQTRQLTVDGRTVVFVGNPNVLTELVRLGKIDGEALAPDHPAVRVLHGARLFTAVQDKVLQQVFFRDTAVRRLRTLTLPDRSNAVRVLRRALAVGPLVVKPNGTSGGAGVHVVTPAMADAEIETVLDRLVDDCLAKYGEGFEDVLFPLRAFEFVASTGFERAGGGHLWDLRVGLELQPGRIDAYPVSMRLTPAPFDPKTFHKDRAQWVSNVSGRTERLLYSGMDQAALDAVGLTAARMEDLFAASVTWAMRAWDAAGRGSGAVYEDRCELENPDFYPQQAFDTGAR